MEYIDKRILQKIAYVQNELDKYVYLRKDDKGYYIEYAFADIEEKYPHDNRCLSWYVKRDNDPTFVSMEVDKIYRLSSFSCSPDSGCSPGNPKLNCAYLAGNTEKWSYDDPKKCACWHLETLNLEKHSFRLTFEQVKRLFNLI